MYSIRNSCVVMACDVPTVVINEKQEKPSLLGPNSCKYSLPWRPSQSARREGAATLYVSAAGAGKDEVLRLPHLAASTVIVTAVDFFSDDGKVSLRRVQRTGLPRKTDGRIGLPPMREFILCENYSPALATSVSTTAKFCIKPWGRPCRFCRYPGLL
jgi:hypothetical protein